MLELYAVACDDAFRSSWLYLPTLSKM
jgi:hypothetical protein